MKTRDDLKNTERRRIEDLEIKVMKHPADIEPKIELSTAFFSAGLFFDALNLLDEIDAHHFSQESYRLRLYYKDCFLIMFNPDNEHLQDEELREKFKKLYPFVKENIEGGFFTDAHQARVLYKAFGSAYFIDLAYYFLRRAAELGHPQCTD